MKWPVTLLLWTRGQMVECQGLAKGVIKKANRVKVSLCDVQ